MRLYLSASIMRRLLSMCPLATLLDTEAPQKPHLQKAQARLKLKRFADNDTRDDKGFHPVVSK